MGINREKEIRINPDFAKETIREEARAETVLQAKKEPILETPRLQVPEPTESNFAKLVQRCEQRLYDLLERKNMPLTPQRTDRIALQAERTAAFIWHAHGETSFLPAESEMVNFSFRAKYELDRLPELQKDLMDQEEKSPYRAYQIADRLASIEGRLYFEALQKGIDEPFNMPFMARREFNQNQQQVIQLMKDLSNRYFIPQTIAYPFAQDSLRYRETHGENPSANQMEKMVEISRHLDNKECGDRSYSRDAGETVFLRRREGDLLFRHGASYDASRDLDQSKIQANKSLENIQRKVERDREQQKQMDLSL